MKHLLLIFVSALALMGCASLDYAQYAAANQAIETARHQAEAAKYKALADIAAQGDSSAKVAAVMAMALGEQSGAAAGNGLRAPEPNQALQWASILVPSLTQVAGMRYNFLTAQTQSNNATALGISTNGTFANMGTSIGSTATAGNASLATVAGMIQAPAANITTTLSGTGTMGAGSYTTNANPVLSGTGTLGSGAYSTVDTHSTDNHTVTPTPVVITPVIPIVPVVVNQPIVVNPPVVITPITPIVPVVITPIAAP